MRRRDNHVGFGKSFDSFLSIVTKNGLGMLILVAMASTITNDQVLSEPGRFKPSRAEQPTRPLLQGDELVLKEPLLKLTMGTPLLKKPPDGAPIAVFECQGDRVFHSDIAAVTQAYEDFFKGFSNGADMDKLAEKFNAQRLGNEWYAFEFKARCKELRDEPAIYCVPKSKKQGETLDEAKKPDSFFRYKLYTRDKTKPLVVLRVWPDSFAFLREFRAWLQTEGYGIRWEPVERPSFLNPKYVGPLDGIDT
jgi:hypothetical protein